MVLLVLDHRGHFVLVEPLRPKRRTSGGGVKKCMTYCTDVVSEDKVHGDPIIPCIVVWLCTDTQPILAEAVRRK